MNTWLKSLDKINFQQLMALPPESTQMVTVNNQLALRLKRQSVSFKSDGNEEVFELPTVLSWKPWYQQLFESCVFESQSQLPDTLSAFESLLYWERALDLLQVEHLNKEALAKNLQQAYELEFDWSVEVYDYESTPEYEFYKQVKQQYLKELKNSKQFVDQSQSQKLLFELLQENKQLNCLPNYLVVAGYYELSKAQEKLLECLEQQGVKIYFYATDNLIQAQPNYIKAQDQFIELKMAIDWAYEKASKNPDKQYAILDPELQTRASTVRRYLLERKRVNNDYVHINVDVGVGRPLSQWPLVRSTLMFFELLFVWEEQQRVDTRFLGQCLLNTSHNLLSSKRNALLQSEIALRELNKTHLSQKEFICFIEKKGNISLSDFFKLFFESIHSISQQRQTINHWHHYLISALNQLQFPGLTQINSTQYQLCQAFDETLQELLNLESHYASMTGSQFIKLIKRLCAEKLFQPQEQKKVQLQVIGLFEAIGGNWDGVWILSLQDKRFPANPEPNAFLPSLSLKRHHAPRSNYEREYEWSEKLLKNLLQISSEINCSWFEYDGDTYCYPSPLLVIDQAQIKSPLSDRPKEKEIQLETIKDNQGPVLNYSLNAGSRLLELQALNPLWAFAEYRLKMKALRHYPKYELDPLLKGNYIHKVLELFWVAVKDHAHLVSLDQISLEQLLDQKLNEAARLDLALSSEKVAMLQKKLVKQLILKNLAQEKQREPFTVLALEEKTKFLLDQLQINLRVDRIDQVPSGKIFIDYKSGAIPNYKDDWSRPRPINLQLPIYACTAPNEAVGVVFESLKIDAVKAKGWVIDDWLYRDDGFSSSEIRQLDRVSPEKLTETDWKQVLIHWKTQIEHLANEFKQGVATNQYLVAKDLNYCDIRAFLRLEQTEYIEESGNE